MIGPGADGTGLGPGPAGGVGPVAGEPDVRGFSGWLDLTTR